MALVKMKDIQANKTTSAPAAAAPKKTSSLVPMSEIKAKRAAATPAPAAVQPQAPVYDPNWFDPTISLTTHLPYAAPAAAPAPQPEPSKWNGPLDNPIAQGAGVGLSWAFKPFETISAGLADATGAVNNLIQGGEKVYGFDGSENTTYPSIKRNFFTDAKKIWSQTDEHTSNEAWQYALPMAQHISGLDKDINWADFADFAAQNISPAEVALPLKLAKGLSGEKTAFKQAIDEFIVRTQQAPVNADGVPTAYATAGKQGLIQEAPKTLPQSSIVPMKEIQAAREIQPKSSLVPMKEIQAAREPVQPVESPVIPAKQSAPIDTHVTLSDREIVDEMIRKLDEMPMPWSKPNVQAAREPVKPVEAPIAPEIVPYKVQKSTPKPLPEKVNNPNWVSGDDLSYYTDNLYRETDADGALDLIPGTNRRTGAIDQSDLYFANSPEHAIGQGTNKGIVIEMDSKGFDGYLDTKKPGWEFSYKNGDAEFVATANEQQKYMDAVKSVTIKPDAVMRKVPKIQLQRILADWEQVKNADGSVTYLRPGAAAKAETAVASAAEPAAASNIVKMADIQAMRAPKKVEPLDPQSYNAAPSLEDQRNYAGNQMPFRQASGQTDRTINRNKVIRNMAKNLGLTIDVGRLGKGTRGVLGIFKTTPEVIRSGMAEDIQTISHEAGHALDKKFMLGDPYFRGELDQLMQFTGHNTGAYTAAQQLEEGVAEYVRLYLTDRANALKYAPKFTDHFEESLSAKALKGLEATTRDIDTWINQGSVNQAKGLVDFDSVKPKPSMFSWNKIYTENVDDLHPLYLAEKALTGKMGEGKDSIYKMARNSRGVAERAKLAVTDGIYINGVKVSDGLRQIVKPLQEAGISEKEFATYLDVKHAIDLKALKKRVPFSNAQINDVMHEFDTPLMQEAQQKIVKWNNALLEIAVEAGNKSQKSIDAMQELYPNYVPYMRLFEDAIEAGFKNGGFGASSAFANITDPIKKMSEEGSYKTLINPLESMVKNAFLVMNAAAKNKVGLQLAELSKVEGAGAWVEKVTGASSPTDHVINVWENGNRQGYKIRNADLYNAMLTLDHESSTALIRFLGGAAGVLRAGATLTPEFMVRNSARDVMEAFIKVGMHPVDFVKGLVAVLGKSDAYNNFLSDGGAMGTMMALDRESLQREAMSKVFRKSLRDKTLDVVTSPKQLALMLTGVTPAKKAIGVLRRGAEISELSTKVGTYKRVLRKTGSREEAAFVARDLMDFNRAGSNIRQSNRVIAFLNASIQGTDGMIRAIKRDPAGYLVRAFVGLSLPAIANYYVNKNLDPENRKIFENIPRWQKDSFFIVHVPGTNKFARIPKPFEVGAIFATGTERIMEALDGKDPDAFKGYGKSLLTSVTPPILLSMYTPILEAITNHSFFTRAPIVSQSYDRYLKQDQYDPIKTSETAKLMAKGAAAVGLGGTNAASPLIIDNTIHGYTGGLGQYAVSGLDKLLSTMGVGSDTPKPAKHWEESMLARPFFASTSGGGQIRQDFYSKWDKLTAAKSSADLNEEAFTDPLYPQMKAAKSYIDKALKEYKLIKNSKTMNSEDKRIRMDKLDGIINAAAAQGLGK